MCVDLSGDGVLQGTATPSRPGHQDSLLRGEPMTYSVPQGAALDAAYATCRDLHRTHGRSYYLATRLLPPWKRRHVHALYGFTRYTDDIVDAGGAAQHPSQESERDREQRLESWAARFSAALD